MITFYSIVCVFLSVFYLKLIGSYLKGWLKTSEKHLIENFVYNTKVSIIVTGRNEEKNIEKCLTSLNNQSYNRNNYEILFVNDFSEDDTLLKVQKFSTIKILDLKQFLSPEFQSKANKKRGISLAVEQAEYDVIITCDADCFYGENWLKSFVQKYEKHHYKLITAPVAFVKEEGFFSKFLALDLISMMGITCGSIKNNAPSMVNGANLLFLKSAFVAVNGFEGNEDIPSGDDVFLMQKINKKYKNSIAFLKNSQAIAFTKAPDTFKEFVNQRIRWSSKSVTHADKNVTRDLALNYFFYVFTLVNLFILSFLNVFFLKIGIAMFAIKLFIDIVFFQNVLPFFKRMDIFKYLIFIELFHLVYVSLIGLFSLYGKYSWKGRKV